MRLPAAVAEWTQAPRVMPSERCVRFTPAAPFHLLSDRCYTNPSVGFDRLSDLQNSERLSDGSFARASERTSRDDIAASSGDGEQARAIASTRRGCSSHNRRQVGQSARKSHGNDECRTCTSARIREGSGATCNGRLDLQSVRRSVQKTEAEHGKGGRNAFLLTDLFCTPQFPARGRSRFIRAPSQRVSMQPLQDGECGAKRSLPSKQTHSSVVAQMVRATGETRQAAGSIPADAINLEVPC